VLTPALEPEMSTGVSFALLRTSSDSPVTCDSSTSTCEAGRRGGGAIKQSGDERQAREEDAASVYGYTDAS
jgi:hypothetical protein